jgi:FkbM family methyltransferase
MHNGDDTEYYLLKGAEVVGIEANPALLPGLRSRFAGDISAHRLTLIDKAVGPEEKLVPFYVGPGNALQSSMVRKRVGFSQIEVQAVRLSSLMQEYGLPAFAKIDVEFMDGAVLDDLNRFDMVPPHLSVEVHAFDIFFRLYAMGFTQFRLINCREFENSSRTIQSVLSTVPSFLTPFLITPAVRSVTIFRSPGKHSSRSAPSGSVANHYLDGAGTTSTHAGPSSRA